MMMRIAQSALAAALLALVIGTSQADDYVVEHNECSGYEHDGTCYMLNSPNAVTRNEDLYGTCEVYLPLDDYLTVADAKSQYQFISFMENPVDGDRCMDLDDTVQICTNYRPHYHEPFVHFTGAYLESMKRVVFVGGGDSMLLHEVLKYPTVELVLGLELDQKVVRHSLKHFKTQPHFDDERVQWWFGDATKSMRMLPKEYFGSFDLVLVDLSETVMSFPVTKELDIMGALALLLKPDGIFVKNELYFKKLKEIFDYTVQLWLPDNPMICDQDFVMGSNRIDFLKPNFNLLREHDVETLLLKPLEDVDDHFRLFYEYSKNNARAQGKCKEIKESEDDDDDGADRAGILLIVEAENVTGIKNKPMAELENAFKSALEKGGLTPLSVVRKESKSDGAVIAIALREGYLVVHTWPQHDYVGFDLNLWGGFEKQEPTRDALLDAVGGSKKGAWSSYRIIVGGMVGANTWSEDKKRIGPVITQNRDCSKREPRTNEERVDEATMDIAVEESLKLVLDREVAVVLCGEHNETKPCSSLDVVRKSESFTKVVALWACPPTSSTDESIADDDDNVVTNISLCGKIEVAKEIMKIAEENDGISAIIVDTSIPKSMVRNTGQWSNAMKELVSMERPFVLITPIWKKSGAWKRFSLIPMMRTGLDEWPIRKVSVKIENAEMHYFASGDDGFTRRLIDVVDGITTRSGRNAEVINIKPGTMEEFEQPDYNPHLYEPDDYDPVPGQEQFTSQRPVGYQSLIQLVVDEEKVKKSDGGAANLSTDRVKAALSDALPQMNFEEFSDVGEGEMFIGLLADGHAIAVWDGAKHLDLNIFTYYGQVVDHKKVTDRILQSLSELKVMLLDEMPRGFGRVVNFIEDIDASPDCADKYTLCMLEADNGKCSKKSDWHMTNCKKSCGLCEADLLKDKYDLGLNCTDYFATCSHEWYEQDECDDNPEFMGRYCKKTCGLCDEEDDE